MEASRAREISNDMNTLDKVLSRVENAALEGYYTMYVVIEEDVIVDLIDLGYKVERSNMITEPSEYKITW